MSKQRLEGGESTFAQGEAEELVRELRGHLRMEGELRRRGEAEGSARARMRATSIVGELASRLERRFERYAWAYFGGYAPQLVDEAVSEMFTELCRRLMDTSPANELMERRFNLVVKDLIVDAVRRVRRQNDLTPDKGEPDRAGYDLVSLEAANERAADAARGERLARPLQIADPEAEEGYARIVERMLGRIGLEWLRGLPARQRRVVQDRILDGLEWTEVADRVGVTARTAQTDLRQALDTLRAMYEERLEGGRR